MATKQVAQSIRDLTASDLVTRILRRTEPIDDIIDILKDHWAYDLYSRRPGPALLENGVLTPTDLDLSCFLAALVDRRAVINIPKYKSRRVKSTPNNGETVTSSTNRHGQITGLSANKETFNFSLRMQDANVVNMVTGTVGAPRNFMLTDFDGQWWEGWEALDFVPTAKENEFLTKNNLWTGTSVHFVNFVHPNRWTSLYGQYFLISKLLLQRMSEEASFYRAEAKRLIAEGVTPPVKAEEKMEFPQGEKEEGVSIKVDAFEVLVDAPFTGDFPSLPLTQAALQEAQDKARRYSYVDAPIINFSVRATELAFYNQMQRSGNPPFPTWFKNAKWEDGYVPEGKRTAYNRLVLAQLVPGQKGFAMRFRTWKKTEKVAQ